MGTLRRTVSQRQNRRVALTSVHCRLEQTWNRTVHTFVMFCPAKLTGLYHTVSNIFTVFTDIFYFLNTLLHFFIKLHVCQCHTWHDLGLLSILWFLHRLKCIISILYIVYLNQIRKNYFYKFFVWGKNKTVFWNLVYNLSTYNFLSNGNFI